MQGSPAVFLPLFEQMGRPTQQDQEPVGRHKLLTGDETRMGTNWDDKNICGDASVTDITLSVVVHDHIIHS